MMLTGSMLSMNENAEFTRLAGNEKDYQPEHELYWQTNIAFARILTFVANLTQQDEAY